MKRTEPNDTEVYLVVTNFADGIAPPVKVGITKDLAKRLPSLQTGNPYPLKCLATWPICGCSKHIEQVFHRIQADHRLSGEWFNIDPVSAWYMVEVYVREQFIMSGTATKEQIESYFGTINERAAFLGII